MSSFKIPKKVNVLGVDFKVERVAPEKIQNDFGECSIGTRTIKINKNLDGEMAFVTFLHEYRHAVQFVCGSAQFLSHETMEVDSELFAYSVLSLIEQGII